ncbi:MAG: glutamine-hydrolyzing GMP synthase, partial [Alkalispirochaetaceae bacterium]
MEKIVVLDFGSQTTHLIARRLREGGVLAEVVPGDEPFENWVGESVKGVILSGSPASVHQHDAPRVDQSLLSSSLPVLGICYGLQRLTHDSGGSVATREKREYGRAAVALRKTSPLTEGMDDRFTAWMSHGDTVEEPAPGSEVIGETVNGVPAIVRLRQEPPVYGLQFHPEVTHTDQGRELLLNFATRVCGARREWSVEVYLEQISERLPREVGNRPVLLLISGGVDSTVVAATLLKLLSPEQVHLMYIDTGLMRLDETEEVSRELHKLGARNLYIIDAEREFLHALAGVRDPEEKRHIIGDLFISVQQREIARHIPDAYMLAQGTLYTDMIESGRGVGGKAKVIKSHHNVASPLVARKRERGELLEPLQALYKDEVRELGAMLGVSPGVIERHPFPGPGLAVRILGDVTKEKCDTLRAADAIYIEELKKRGIYDEIWQAFSVLLPVQSVGVAGDDREYGYVLALRAVVSRDGMTADVYRFPMDHLLEISSRITNEVHTLGRVVYDVS